jgi:thiol-disulfide isomerase/thioredoxin
VPLSRILVLFALAVVPVFAQDQAKGPSSEKAQKAYNDGLEQVRRHNSISALDDFRKADKQDGGRCLACQRKIVKYAVELQDWKAAQNAAGEMVAEAQGEKNIALAHFEAGIVLLDQAQQKHKDELFTHAHQEFTQALAAFANFPDALLSDGKALAYLKQDDAAKAQFEKYVKMRTADDLERRRAMRFLIEPELARARMAPPFAVTSLDGQHISLDDLQGKVVLIDFWATWCAPCREALPHVRDIARKFQGQPLVLLSISLDTDERKWKEYIEKNKMSWLQYRDGGFTGPISTLFDVRAIPHTFTIDADGVLQDEHIGDASIEGKLKKLVARAQELQAPTKPLQ